MALDSCLRAWIIAEFLDVLYTLAAMLPLFSPTFWFDMTPFRMGTPFTIFFAITFLALVLGGIVLRTAKVKQLLEKEVRRLSLILSSDMILWGVLGLAWVLFSYGEIPFFGSRFWVLIIAGVLGRSVYGYYMVYTREIPAQRLRRVVTQSQRAYLPRRAR